MLWLWSRGVTTQADVWHCDQCHATGEIVMRDDSAAIAHVIDTGHDVVASWTTMHTYLAALPAPANTSR